MLDAEVRAFIERESGKAIEDMRLERLAGGASHEAWSVDVRFKGESAPLQLVMRRSMGGALTTIALDREREFEVVRAAYESGVPVPRPYWLGANVDGRPAFFMQRVAGETVGRKLVTDARFAPLHPLLCKQFGEFLARIHAVDYRRFGLDRFLQQPSDGRTPAQMEIARLYRELDMLGEPHPALELGLRWLIAHEPAARATTFVHGDYRMGNVIVAEEGIRAVLDWEFAHVGDPAEDLGWVCVRAWRFGGEGRVGGIGAVGELLAAYRDAGGAPVDEAALFYWEVLGNVKWAMGALHQARRHLNGDERSIELASLGRIAAEMEYETLMLIEHAA